MSDVGRFGLGDMGDVGPKRADKMDDLYVGLYPSLVGSGPSNADVVNGDYIRTWPFFIPTTQRFDEFVWLQLALGAATYMRFGIYTNKMGTLYPDKLIWAGQEWNLATMGVYYKEESIPSYLTLSGPRIYWLASHKGGNNASYGRMTGIAPHLPTYRVNSAYGALPATFPAEESSFLSADYPAAAWLHRAFPPWT